MNKKRKIILLKNYHCLTDFFTSAMIEQIGIYNYKSIREAVIAFRMINVLIGANGAGKSNLISFFDLTRHLLEQRLNSYLLQHGGIDPMLYRGRKVSDYILGRIDFDNRNTVEFKLRPTPGPNAYIEYTKDYFNKDGVSDKNYSETWYQHIWDTNVTESAILNRPQWRAGYIREFLKSFTVYHFHDTSLSSPMRRAARTGDNEYLRNDGSNLAPFLYRLKATDVNAYNLIEGTIRSIAPYFKCFKLNPDRNMEGYISLEWEEKDSDMYLDVANFSDGTLRFIALATLLLQPNPPETIIIDEPELGLHPAAIVKLGALVRRASRKAQVIIATQSSSVVDCFSPEDIIVVSRRNSQSVFDRLDADRYSAWLSDYSLGEVWEKNIIGGQP